MEILLLYHGHSASIPWQVGFSAMCSSRSGHSTLPCLILHSVRVSVVVEFLGDGNGIAHYFFLSEAGLEQNSFFTNSYL